ncbi:MAG: phosphatase PAP2 family protein [Ruminococcaceae bacterium]|nr:phosphatase PAP2 family protein [Oscillospiraceae bacterium]
MTPIKLPPPIADYRKLRFNNITSDEFRHVLLLLYWPLYGLLFMFAERFYTAPAYFAVYCPLDDKIPFCELFVVPYLFWFLYLIGMHVYTLLYDIEAFKKMMKFIIFTYSVTIVIYFLFPTCQELRPVQFERDNFLTRFMEGFYRFDTNTNVCPSIHVIGTLAVLFTALHCRSLQRIGQKTAFILAAVLICASTVFLKQHSVLDVLAALLLCLIGYFVCFQSQQKRCKR